MATILEQDAEPVGGWWPDDVGMPVGCEFCTTGTRSLKAFAEYVRDVGIRGQDDTVMRQRACEALGQKWRMEFTPMPAEVGVNKAEVDHLAMAERDSESPITRGDAIRHIIAHLREKGGA